MGVGGELIIVFEIVISISNADGFFSLDFCDTSKSTAEIKMRQSLTQYKKDFKIEMNCFRFV